MVYDDMGCDDVDDGDDSDDVQSLKGHRQEQSKGRLHLKLITKKVITCMTMSCIEVNF